MILALWPTYFMPNNPQCTFSPTALKHYLSFPEVTTNHLVSLNILTTTGIRLTFPSIKQQVNGQLLDYHQFSVARPIGCVNRLSSHHNQLPPLFPDSSNIVMKGTVSPLTRNLCHQRLSHCCDVRGKKCMEELRGPRKQETQCVS
jgi:hypothetical protein